MPILKYIIINAIRNRIYLGLMIFLIIAIAISIFIGSTSFVEQQQFTVAYIAGLSRVIIQFGMILFACLTISKAFENKEIEFLISKPISREQFILSYFAGFAIAGIIILLPLFFIMLLLCKLNYIGFLLWTTTLTCEMILTICFAILSSFILKNSFTAIFASCGFYIIARLMGIFTLSIESFSEIASDSSYLMHEPLKILLKTLSVIFPRFDLLAETKWLNYGINDFSSFKIIFYQVLIYLPLMIHMAFHDFRKKQF
jgi:ABC-type transport system involved in multi-copper enzyme maturation permease subunit